MSTYELIQKLCKQNKIAVTALEKELGFGRGSIGKMKNGSTSADRLNKIADYFDVSTDYMYELTDMDEYGDLIIDKRDPVVDITVRCK